MNIVSCTKVGCIFREGCSGCIGKSAPLKYFSQWGKGDAAGKIRIKRRLCPPGIAENQMGNGPWPLPLSVNEITFTGLL